MAEIFDGNVAERKDGWCQRQDGLRVSSRCYKRWGGGICHCYIFPRDGGPALEHPTLSMVGSAIGGLSLGVLGLKAKEIGRAEREE